MNLSFFIDHPWLIMLLLIWEIIWKGFALWNAAQHKHMYWFIALLIINTVGILPIVYLVFFQNTKKTDNLKL